MRGIQGTRAGDRGCTADGRLGEPSRRPAAMLTESMSTPPIASVTSDIDAHLLDLKMMFEDACEARHASRQQEERSARGPESVRSVRGGGSRY